MTWDGPGLLLGSQPAVYDHMAVSDQNDSTKTCLGLDSVRAKLSMVSTRPLATIRAMAIVFKKQFLGKEHV